MFGNHPFPLTFPTVDTTFPLCLRPRVVNACLGRLCACADVLLGPLIPVRSHICRHRRRQGTGSTSSNQLWVRSHRWTPTASARFTTASADIPGYVRVHFEFRHCDSRHWLTPFFRFADGTTVNLDQLCQVWRSPPGNKAGKAQDTAFSIRRSWKPEFNIFLSALSLIDVNEQASDGHRVPPEALRARARQRIHQNWVSCQVPRAA